MLQYIETNNMILEKNSSESDSSFEPVNKTDSDEELSFDDSRQKSKQVSKKTTNTFRERKEYKKKSKKYDNILDARSSKNLKYSKLSFPPQEKMIFEESKEKLNSPASEQTQISIDASDSVSQNKRKRPESDVWTSFRRQEGKVYCKFSGCSKIFSITTSTTNLG